MNVFLNYLALIFGILASGLLILRILGALTYTDINKLVDQMKGIRRTFPLAIPLVVSIVCWLWFIAKPLG